MGTGVLRKYGRERRSNMGICPKAARGRGKEGRAKIMERQQRMTLSGIVVSEKATDKVGDSLLVRQVTANNHGS